MFRILWDPSSGSIKSASLKLLVMFCVRSRCLAAWNFDLWCVCLVRRVENYCGSQLGAPTPCPPQQQDTIYCKNLSLTLLMMGKSLPETCWAYLIDQ